VYDSVPGRGAHRDGVAYGKRLEKKYIRWRSQNKSRRVASILQLRLKGREGLLNWGSGDRKGSPSG